MDGACPGGRMWIRSLIGGGIVVLRVGLIGTMSDNWWCVHEHPVSRTAHGERTPMPIRLPTEKTVNEAAAA